jgi:hypothetical protein
MERGWRKRKRKRGVGGRPELLQLHVMRRCAHLDVRGAETEGVVAGTIGGRRSNIPPVRPQAGGLVLVLTNTNR